MFATKFQMCYYCIVLGMTKEIYHVVLCCITKIYNSNFISYAPKMLINMVTLFPRRLWYYSSDDHAMEITRKRINRGVRSNILKHGGYVIKYPNFADRHSALFSDDELHSSIIGNDFS